MEKLFNQKIEKSELRDCQSIAYDKLLEHFTDTKANKHVLIQLPTGTGKSALIAIAPFNIAKKKVLILTPNVTLAKQLENELDFVNNQNENIYKKLKIFSNELLNNLELYVLRLENEVNPSDIKEHQIIISNYQQFSNLEKWFKNSENLIDLIIIDESHHQKAKTYQKIIQYFKNAKIISLTATPFRSDGQKIDGENIYTYHFSEAIKKKYIRNIKISNVSPQQISLSFSNENNKIYSFEDIIKMKEEAWFRQGIALSQDCCDSIAQKAYEKLQDLRSNFKNTSHQIIAVAISIRHARVFVKPAFEKLGLKVGLVSSKDNKTNDAIFKKLDQDKIDVIINVGMLGEGFDHKKLWVAAIFRPFATLNPYIQFIGRVIRSNEQTKYCWVVSHLGLNQIKRFDEFKLFDNDDKEFLQQIFLDSNKNIDHEDSFIEETESNSNNFLNDTVNIKEIGKNVLDFESQFINDKKIICAEDSIEKLNEEEKQKLFSKYGFKYDVVSENAKKRIKPVDKRKAEKNNLNEKEKSIATDIIKTLGLKIYDRNFNPLRKNFVWVKSQIGRDVNKKLNIKNNERKKLTNKELEKFINSGELEKIKNERMEYFKNKLK